MPRSAGLDLPNVLQHVMASGTEGLEILRDRSRVRKVSRVRGAFFPRAHEEAGGLMSALAVFAGAHTSVREAIEKASWREGRGASGFKTYQRPHIASFSG